MSDGRPESSQNISHDSKKEKKHANEKGQLKKSSKGTKEKMLTDTNYRRNYEVVDVTKKPNVVSFILV